MSASARQNILDCYVVMLRDFSAYKEDLGSAVGEIMDILEADDACSMDLGPLCTQFMNLYQNEERFQFVHEFIPVLIWIYLYAKSRSYEKCATDVEACLLMLYNLEVENKSGASAVRVINLPRSRQPSLYHEPTSVGESSLPRADSLQRTIKVGPFPQVDKIRPKNRGSVLSHLLRSYHYGIDSLSDRSHYSLCVAATRLCGSGFAESAGFDNGLPEAVKSKSNLNYGASLCLQRRIGLASQLMLELANCLYFAMFNGQSELGVLALDCMHFRASYECFADVLLVTSAIKNSLETNPSGQPSDGPMGVSISVTPAHALSSLHKSAITNASFKTRKLPDDIPIESNSNGAGEAASSPAAVPTSDKLRFVDKLSAFHGPLKKVAMKKVEWAKERIKLRPDNSASSTPQQQQSQSPRTSDYTEEGSATPTGGPSGLSSPPLSPKHEADDPFHPKAAGEELAGAPMSSASATAAMRKSSGRPSSQKKHHLSYEESRLSQEEGRVVSGDSPRESYSTCAGESPGLPARSMFFKGSSEGEDVEVYHSTNSVNRPPTSPESVEMSPIAARTTRL